MPKFDSIDTFLAHCHKLIQQDLDCVILFVGDPGNGKSNTAIQLGKALDPTYNVDRISFNNVKEFLGTAKNLLPGQVVHADEIDLHRRKAMTRETKEVLDFLRICRGLNLFIFICFPFESDLDSDILDQRVRYKVEIQTPKTIEQNFRIVHVYERKKHTFRNRRGEEEYVVEWEHCLSFKSYANKGAFREEYLAKKTLAARVKDAESKGSNLEAELESERIKKGGHPLRMKHPGERGKRINFKVREESPLHRVFHPAVGSKDQEAP